MFHFMWEHMGCKWTAFKRAYSQPDIHSCRQTALKKRERPSTQCYESLAKTKRRHHLQSAGIVTALPLLTSVKTHRAPFTGWPFQHTYFGIASNDIGFSQRAFWVVDGSQDSFVAWPGWRSISFPVSSYLHWDSTESTEPPVEPSILFIAPPRLHFLQRQVQWAGSLSQMINLFIIWHHS